MTNLIEGWEELIKILGKAFLNQDLDPEQAKAVMNKDTKEYDYIPIHKLFAGVMSPKQAVSRLQRRKGPNVPDMDVGTRCRVINDFIAFMMETKGEFLYSPKHERVYYHNNKDHQTYQFDDNLYSYLCRNFGFRMDNEGKTVFKSIELYGRTYGKTVEVKNIFHYDKNNNILYVNNGNGFYYVLDGSEIRTEPNGTNGLYFIGCVNKFQYLEGMDIKNNNLKNALCNINFAKSFLSKEQQTELIYTLFLSVPFLHSLNTRPILVIFGEPGSGKTFVLKKMGTFFYGEGYQVNMAPDNAKDTVTVASQYDILFLDNVDEIKPWLLDIMATIATGAKMAKRKLYKDFQVVASSLNCFLGVTSMKGKFNRLDISDRSLIFNVERFNTYQSEVELLRPFVENQDEFWTIYLNELNIIISALKDTDMSKMLTTHRMADWAILAQIIYKSLKLGEDWEFEEMMEMLTLDRSRFALKNSKVFTYLSEFVKTDWTNKYSKGRLTAGEIATELNQIKTDMGSKDHNFDPHWLGKTLNDFKNEFKALFGMDIIDRGTKQKQYRFLTPEELEFLNENKKKVRKKEWNRKKEIMSSIPEYNEFDIDQRTITELMG